MKANDLGEAYNVIGTGKGRKYPVLSGRYYTIRNRCNNPKNNRYYLYGARGIKCEWITFSDFLNDMLSSFQEHVESHSVANTQIDRIDVNGNYNKANCRWATRSEQSRNRRDRAPITYKGKTMLISDWSKELGINIFTLYNRIYTYGWPIDKAFNPEKHINQFL